MARLVPSWPSLDSGRLQALLSGRLSMLGTDLALIDDWRINAK